MKYKVYGIEFKSKKHVQECVKKILYRGEINSEVNSKELEFMIDYFKTFHWDYINKIGVGIKSIKKVPDAMFGKHRAFWIYRTDGTNTDISYIISKISKRDFLKDFKCACRELTRPQINEFRKKEFGNNKYIKCELSNDMVTMIDCHVDHSSPTFEEIIQLYLKENPIIDFESILSKPKDCQLVSEIIDLNIRDDFYNFHKSKANLRILSANANLSTAKLNRRKQKIN